MRRRHLFAALLVLAGVLPSVGPARGDETTPLVLAVDVALDADARAYAGATVTWLVGALPADAEIALILYDDVVRHAVPLAPAGGDQLDRIDEALTTSPRDGVSSNVAVGLERGLDELGGRDGAHLVLFADARFGGEDDVARARFADWSREILLPDAAAADIAITLVAPEGRADENLLEELERYPRNAIRVLGAAPPAELVQDLMERLERDDPDTVASATGAGVDENARDPDATGAFAPSPVVVAENTADAGAPPETAAEIPSRTGPATAPDARPAETPAGRPVELVADTGAPADDTIAATDGGRAATLAPETAGSTDDGAAPFGRWPWLVGIGALLVGTVSLLLVWRRQRSSPSATTAARARAPAQADTAGTTAPRGHRPPRGTADNTRGRSPTAARGARRGGPGRSPTADRTLDRTRDRARKKAATARRAPPKRARPEPLSTDDSAATAARTAQRTPEETADPTLERGAGRELAAASASGAVTGAGATATRSPDASADSEATARHDSAADDATTREPDADATARPDDTDRSPATGEAAADDPDATARHDASKDAVDDLELLAELTAERQRRDSLD